MTMKWNLGLLTVVAAALALAAGAQGSWWSCSVSASCPGGGSVGCSASSNIAWPTCTAGSETVTCTWKESCGSRCVRTVTIVVSCGQSGVPDEPLEPLP